MSFWKFQLPTDKQTKDKQNLKLIRSIQTIFFFTKSLNFALRWSYCPTIIGYNFVFNDLLNKTLISYSGLGLSFPYVHLMTSRWYHQVLGEILFCSKATVIFRHYHAYAACKVWIWWLVPFFQKQGIISSIVLIIPCFRENGTTHQIHTLQAE